MPANRQLQRDFSRTYTDAAYNAEGRRQKARKAIAIVANFLGELGSRTALDIGCSTGYATAVYAKHFHRVVATDIDIEAVQHAAHHNTAENLSYAVMNGERIGLPDASVDVVFCMHVYEHVPDAERLMSEIARLLKPQGVCFFTAGNRLSLIEPHYRLPLLSVVPKPLAHLYLRILGRGHHYYENHLTYWGLRRLTRNFQVTDYTRRVVDQPVAFSATDVIRPGSGMQRLSSLLLRFLPWLSPTYLWILQKR